MARCDITVKMVVPTRGSLLEGIRAADTTRDARSFTMLFRGKNKDLCEGKLYFRSPVPTSFMKRIAAAAPHLSFHKARTCDAARPSRIA
jgi:hypothetical protein